MNHSLIALLFATAFNCFALKPVEIHKGDDVIWGMAELDSKKIIYTQKSGEIFIYDKSINKRILVNHPFKISDIGQGGLLDIQYFQNEIYITYATRKNGGFTTELSKGVLEQNKDSAELINTKTIFTASPSYNSTYHFGSRVQFFDNHIYLTVGDRGSRDLAQNLNTHNGKVLKLKMDGTAAADNPFINNKNARPEIYSYGHRNPQGLHITKSGTVYEMEHGPRGGDEINIVEAGKNYGWPIITYGKEYVTSLSIGEGTAKEGMEQPLYYYVPSIAPSGLTYYTGSKYPQLKNKILSGALKLKHLNVLDPKTKKEQRFFNDLGERIRSILVLKDETLLIGSDSGKIYRLDN